MIPKIPRTSLRLEKVKSMRNGQTITRTIEGISMNVKRVLPPEKMEKSNMPKLPATPIMVAKFIPYLLL
jgi:hypothetical protein